MKQTKPNRHPRGYNGPVWAYRLIRAGDASPALPAWQAGRAGRMGQSDLENFCGQFSRTDWRSAVIPNKYLATWLPEWNIRSLGKHKVNVEFYLSQPQDEFATIMKHNWGNINRNICGYFHMWYEALLVESLVWWGDEGWEVEPNWVV